MMLSGVRAQKLLNFVTCSRLARPSLGLCSLHRSPSLADSMVAPRNRKAATVSAVHEAARCVTLS